jgi:hypothetical protein
MVAGEAIGLTSGAFAARIWLILCLWGAKFGFQRDPRQAETQYPYLVVVADQL